MLLTPKSLFFNKDFKYNAAKSFFRRLNITGQKKLIAAFSCVVKLWWIIFWLFCLAGCSLLMPDLFNPNAIADGDLEGILFINEISANHPADADWIELYNSGDKLVDLSGFYLSDSPAEITKWVFPGDTIVQAGSYLIITFATGEADSPEFGLRPGTDELLLTTPDRKSIVDHIPAIPYTGSGSYGRTADGAEDWILFSTPTKGAANS